MAADRSMGKRGHHAFFIALLTTAMSCAATYQGQVGKGDEFLKDQRYDDSIVAYEEALILAEEEGEIVTSEVYVSMAESYEALGNINKAIVYYRRGASMDGGYPELYMKMGSLQETRGMLPEAAAAYQSALSLEPQNSDYLTALRRTLEEANLHGAYVEAVVTMVAMGDEGAAQLKALGMEYLEGGQVDAGVQALEASLDLKADQGEVLSTLGEYYLGQGQMADAERVLLAYLAMAPEDIPTLRGLGEAKIALGDGAGALKAYQSAVALDSGDPSLKAGAQVARHMTGETATALKILKRLTRKTPKEPSLHLAAAYIHLDLGQLKVADRALNLAIPLAPDSYEALRLTGALRLAQGRPGEAIFPLTQARALRPQSKGPAADLCRAFDGTGAVSTEALDACGDALELSPEDMSLVSLSADMLLRAGRYQEGVSVYLTLVRSGKPGSEGKTFDVAQMLLALDRGDDAEGLLVRAEESPEAMALLSRVEAEIYGDDRGRARAESALGAGKSDLRVLSEVARFYITIDEPLEAKALVSKAANRGPKDPNVLKAKAAFDIAQGRGAQAIEQLRALVGKAPGDVDALGLLADALERDGQTEDADALRADLGLR